MRRLAATALTLALLAAVPAAWGRTTWVVKGAGFGHGVGLSQYGAYGLAQHGWNYREILAHYYTGIGLEIAPRSQVRVLLESGQRSIAFGNAARAGSRRLHPTKTYVASRHGAGILLRDSRGKSVASFAGPVTVTGSHGYVRLGGMALNGISGGSYRGNVELRPGLMAIDVVSLDDYVRGVVPGEMSASWSPEALKAQAVAARSYALATDAGGTVFDQYPDTRSQMYTGMSGEDPRTDAAVDATAGIVATYAGQVAATYFFSTSGGKTEDVQNVFYGSAPQPYLKGVQDPYDGIAPRHRWQLRMTTAAIQHKLHSLCAGRFRGIKVVRRGVSRRVVKANVVCSRGRRLANGSQLRSALGLYDTWFSLTKVSATPTQRPRGIFAAVLARLVPQPPARGLGGEFAPAPRSRKVAIERRVHGRWRRERTVRTSATGTWASPVRSAGVYRARAGGVASDPVTVH